MRSQPPASLALTSGPAPGEALRFKAPGCAAELVTRCLCAAHPAVAKPPPCGHNRSTGTKSTAKQCHGVLPAARRVPPTTTPHQGRFTRTYMKKLVLCGNQFKTTLSAADTTRGQHIAVMSSDHRAIGAPHHKISHHSPQLRPRSDALLAFSTDSSVSPFPAQVLHCPYANKAELARVAPLH